MMPADCPRCVAHLAASPHLIGAAASVGIKHGKTTAEMVQVYMRGLHDREHAGFVVVGQTSSNRDVR